MDCVYLITPVARKMSAPATRLRYFRAHADVALPGRSINGKHAVQHPSSTLEAQKRPSIY